MNKNNKLITQFELNQLNAECELNINNDKLYQLQNNAKLRAITTTKTYQEFKSIVDAAHLKSFECKKNKITSSDPHPQAAAAATPTNK